MAPKKLNFHEEAEQEFLAAAEWYLERSELAALNFVQQVTLALQLIADFPMRWPKYFNSSRKFTLRRFPFLVVYRELPEKIQILAVAHGSRRPGYWKSRR
jgi:plasmid stabilization system protein ParE